MNRPEGAVEVLGGQGWIHLKKVHGTELDVVSAARVCLGREDRGMNDKDAALLRSMLSNGHMTPFEFVDLTFLVFCPLYVRAQWFRHRTQAYVEQSRRWTTGEIVFYVPVDVDREARALIEGSHGAAEAAYRGLLARRVRPEIARGVLPQDMMTLFQCRVSLRNLLLFLDLRDDGHAQPEIREYAKAITAMLGPLFPNTMEARMEAKRK